MKLTAHLVYRQGIRLCLDETEVGYFACSGIDAMMLLCTLQLLLRKTINEVEVNATQLLDLREWINERPAHTNS